MNDLPLTRAHHDDQFTAQRAYVYRESFPWWRSLGMTDGLGHFGFIDNVRGRPRYYSPQRMARRLARIWDHPQDRQCVERMTADLDPHWHLSVSEQIIQAVAALPSL